MRCGLMESDKLGSLEAQIRANRSEVRFLETGGRRGGGGSNGGPFRVGRELMAESEGRG